jgi:holliday junction DNA helicase RuvA
MIARLAGRLHSAGADACVVDVGGVGYRVQCSARTLGALPPVGDAVELVIETRVMDDQIRLYGFRGEAERQCFNLLQTVQGVGAKMALSLLATLPPDELAHAIATGDKAALTRAPGVGQKMATRLAMELKDRVGDFAPPLQARETAAGGAAADAVSALVNLGYRRPEALGAVHKAARTLGQAADAAALIRAGLRELAA